MAGRTESVRQRVNQCMSKLSDRDTEVMAASELDAIALTLTPDALQPFLSAISDARPTDKTPLRRHSLRLLSLLSESQPESATLPLLPRMLSAALRRVRDPDSSVRAACVEAVRAMAAAHPRALAPVLLRPLADALLHEQDTRAQAASALALAAAVDASSGSDPGLAHQLQRLVPRLVKLARSAAFKAKPALLSLLGSVSEAGGASNQKLLSALVPCLSEFLGSEDWATRKAAAEALSRVALSERDLLGGFKASCISTFESQRFDKVKIVRESMNRMLEVWKNIPVPVEDPKALQPSSESSCSHKESASDGRFPSGLRNSSLVASASPSTAKNIRFSVSRSPPPAASPIPIASASPSTAKNIRFSVSRSPPPAASPIPIARKHAPPKLCLPSSCSQKGNSDWRAEIVVPHAASFMAACEERNKERVGKGQEQVRNEDNARSNVGVKWTLFGKSGDDKAGKLSGLKSASQVVPVQETGSLDLISGSGNPASGLYGSHKEGESDLSLIRMQLVQIENQQSSLLDLLQRFIGNSQNGIHSLEARVHGLEMALNEISRNLSISSRRVPNNDPAVTCCKLPGAYFLTSKFWRLTEGRYSARFSLSSSPTLPTRRNMAGKCSGEPSKSDKQSFGEPRGVFVVNPLAEIDHHSSRSTEVLSNKVLHGVAHNMDIRHADGKTQNEVSQK